MRHKILFLLAVFFLFAAPVLAQTAPIEIDPAVVQKIIDGGVLGIGFTLLVELLKAKLHLQGPFVFVGSFVVSAVLTVFYFLAVSPPLTLGKGIAYTVVVWVIGNGWYKLRTEK